MIAQSVRTDDPTPAQCLAILKAFHQDERCQRCRCLDWALAELQERAPADVAEQASLLRVAPEQLHAVPGCRLCMPVDATIAWLLAGRHDAGL